MPPETKRSFAKYPEADLTGRILQAAFKVHNTLGCGFLEKVYENALVVELSRMGAAVSQQHPFKVNYENAVVGDYVADLVVEGRVLVECKCSSQPDGAHEAQLLNYLKASGIRVGLLLNFGRPKLYYRRMIV